MFVSHLLLAPLAFTSQAPPSAGAATGAVQPSQEVTIRARQQEKRGDIYTLDGDVEILFQNYVLRADHGTYNEATGEVQGSGRLVFDGGPHDAHLVASHAIYNVKDDTGTFYDVSGTFGAVVRGNNVVLTTSNPFVIAGGEVRKVGPDRYIVSHGSITSCAEQTPKWTFNASKIDLVAGDDAKLYHSSFRLMKLPIFYFPYTRLPANGMARTSGFLLPTAGDSTTKGFILGEGVYWAINRSNDLTLSSEYYSSRGWSQSVHFRSKPSEKSSIELHYFGVMDRGITILENDVPVLQKQGGEEAKLLAETTRDDWRASASVDYLSSFLFRQAWSETYSQAIDAEVKSVAYLSHNRDGVFAQRQRRALPGLLPESADQHILQPDQDRSPAHGGGQRSGAAPAGLALFWAVDASAGGMQRSEPGATPSFPGFATANLVGRLDIRPRVALPLQWNGWNLRPEIAVEDTLYTQQLIPASPLLANPVGSGRRQFDQPPRRGSLHRTASSGAGEGLRPGDFRAPPQARDRANLHLQLHHRHKQLPAHHPLRSDRHSHQHQRIPVRHNPAHLRTPPPHPSGAGLRGQRPGCPAPGEPAARLHPRRQRAAPALRKRATPRASC